MSSKHKKKEKKKKRKRSTSRGGSGDDKSSKPAPNVLIGKVGKISTVRPLGQEKKADEPELARPFDAAAGGGFIPMQNVGDPQQMSAAYYQQPSTGQVPYYSTYPGFQYPYVQEAYVAPEQQQQQQQASEQQQQEWQWGGTDPVQWAAARANADEEAGVADVSGSEAVDQEGAVVESGSEVVGQSKTDGCGSDIVGQTDGSGSEIVGQTDGSGSEIVGLTDGRGSEVVGLSKTDGCGSEIVGQTDAEVVGQSKTNGGDGSEVVEQEVSVGGGSGSDVADGQTIREACQDDEIVPPAPAAVGVASRSGSEVVGQNISDRSDPQVVGHGVMSGSGSEVVEMNMGGSGVADNQGAGNDGIVPPAVGVAPPEEAPLPSKIPSHEPEANEHPPMPDTEEAPVLPPLPMTEGSDEADDLLSQQPPLPAAEEMLRDPSEVARDLHRYPPPPAPAESIAVAVASREDVVSHPPLSTEVAGEEIQPQKEIEECDMDIDSPSAGQGEGVADTEMPASETPVAPPTAEPPIVPPPVAPPTGEPPVASPTGEPPVAPPTVDPTATPPTESPAPPPATNTDGTPPPTVPPPAVTEVGSGVAVSSPAAYYPPAATSTAYNYAYNQQAYNYAYAQNYNYAQQAAYMQQAAYGAAAYGVQPAQYMYYGTYPAAGTPYYGTTYSSSTSSSYSQQTPSQAPMQVCVCVLGGSLLSRPHHKVPCVHSVPLVVLVP
jgi:hypothetical protein